MSQGGGSYIGVYNQLMGIGKSLRKNRVKGLDQAADDLKQLLQTVKVESMNDESPSSRVGEAQVLMAQAVAQRLQGLKQAEAYSYLAASAIWLDVERERRDANYPSTDDALSKGVLCGAIAVGILLSQKPNPATSPASSRLGLAPIPLPHSRHQTKCWGICFSLASALYYDFGCLEMSTDYYEIASQLISRPPLQPGGTTPGTSGATISPAPGNYSGISGGGGTVSSAASVSGKSGAPSTSAAPTTASLAAARNSNTKKSVFASAMERHSSTTTGIGPSSPVGSTRPGTTRTDPSTTGAGDENVSATGTTPSDPGTNNRGGAAPGGERGVGADTTVSTGTHATKGISTFLVSGHFHLYMTSTHRAILIACVLKDYPRARSLADDLMAQWRQVQSIRRGTGGPHGAAQKGDQGPDLPAELPTEDLFRQMSSNYADPTTANSLISGNMSANHLSSSTTPLTAGGVTPTSPAVVSAASGPLPQRATPPPLEESFNVKGGFGAGPPGSNANPRPLSPAVVPDRTDTMSETPTAVHGGTANPSMAGTQRSMNFAAGSVFGQGLAPRRVPPPSSSSQLLASLMEEEEVLIHVHLVRFFLPLLLKESPVVAKRAVHELQDFAELYRELEKTSLAWRRRLQGAAMVRALSKRSNETKQSIGGGGNTGGSNGMDSACQNGHINFSDSLDTISGTLEIILECYETYSTSPAPGVVEEILESAVEDLCKLLSTSSNAGESAVDADGGRSNSSVVGVGHRCRELVILFTRSKDQIVTIPYDLIQ